MKSFKQIITESSKKSEVLLFGRMNPPTSGHEENVLAAHKLAQQHGASLNIIGSHSHDAKKNPLSPDQKLKHLKRAFGHLSDTTIGTSSSEHPTILHQASAAYDRGVKHLILVGGEDRAEGHAKLVKQYNGVEGKAHGYYNFDHITVKNTGARKAGISGTELRKHASSNNYAEFKKNLPSKLASNDAHAHELFSHVKTGLVKKEEFNREAYLSGGLYKLGESVVDSFTGLTGKIVYRGPTYVTIQVDENVSFKRWVEDVQTNLPADIWEHHINRIKFCPSAVEQFSKLLGNEAYDQSIVLTALDKTAHYLDIEEHAHPAVKDTLNDHAISEFVRNMRAAAQLLDTLGVLPDHEAYMEQHAHNLMNIMHGNAPEPREESMDNFKNYYMTEEATTPNEEHLTDDDLRSIEQHIDQLEWEDIRHLYADQEHEEIEEETDLDEANLSAAQRMKKKMEFLKSKAKREIARKIAIKRMSSQGKLKKKAIVHARQLIMQRLLRGRSKASLSAAEKSRIETIVNKAKGAVVRISNRLVPKLRQLEQQRLRHVHEDWSESGDTETKSYETTVSNTTDDSVHANMANIKSHLSGNAGHVDPRVTVNPGKHMRKIKQFRKMEV